MKRQTKKTGMTVEEFREKYNGSGLDVQELAEVASRVHGDVGKKARAVLDALGEFDAALESIDFEVG